MPWALSAETGVRAPGYPNPWLSESLVIRENAWLPFFRNLVFVTSEVPMRFPELRSVLSESENEIYNLGVVPDLQISKKVDFV